MGCRQLVDPLAAALPERLTQSEVAALQVLQRLQAAVTQHFPLG